MEVPCRVKTFNAVEELVHEHSCRLERESVITISEEVIEIGSDEFKHRCPEARVPAMPEYSRDAGLSLQFLIDVDLLAQVRSIDRSNGARV